MLRYADRINAILSPRERRIFQKLDTPQRVQTYLDRFPVNFEISGETNFSPTRVLAENKAHCFEAAIFAAAVMAYHGQKPIILDITTAYEDEDHTVALFRDKKYWGALSKTNHAVLRYRDPIYISPREIAMTYFNEYYMWDSGHKTMRAYATFDLSIFPPERWIIAEDLDWLMKRMSNAYYKDAVPTRLLPKLRRASELERKILSNTEWSKTGKRLYK